MHQSLPLLIFSRSVQISDFRFLHESFFYVLGSVEVARSIPTGGELLVSSFIFSVGTVWLSTCLHWLGCRVEHGASSHADDPLHAHGANTKGPCLQRDFWVQACRGTQRCCCCESTLLCAEGSCCVSVRMWVGLS